MSLLKKIVGLLFFALFLFGTYFGVLSYQNYKAKVEAKKNAKYSEITVTLLPGWTLSQVEDYFEKRGLFSRTEFQTKLGQASVEKYPILQIVPKNVVREGLVFGDTYRLPEKPSIDQVFDKILGNFAKRLEQLGFNETNYKTPLTLSSIDNMGKFGHKPSLYEALVLASIIERESNHGSNEQVNIERKTISGVFWNRLIKGMPLQSDATVNYVTQKNDPTPSLTDIDVASPYNTYKNLGLPPTPICNPSIESIEAALEPIPTDFFYFLHDQKTGEAVFSKTLEDHIKNQKIHL